MYIHISLEKKYISLIIIKLSYKINRFSDIARFCSDVGSFHVVEVKKKLDYSVVSIDFDALGQASNCESVITGTVSKKVG